MNASWRQDILSALRDFSIVSELAGNKMVLAEEDVEFLPAPHVPRSLPTGKTAIYGFWFDGHWLKIGQAGPKSNARYKSQHYTGSAQSTLSGSLRRDASMQNFAGLEENALAEWAAWIKRETSRKSLRSLLEAFLHVRLHPRYEG